MNKLDKLRVEIDNIDKNMIQLINKRQSLADQIIKAKGNSFPFDPERENKLIQKIIGYGLNSNMVERIWRQIISSNLARQKKIKIGILDDDKYSIAAFEVYFGPYFENKFFYEKLELFACLDSKIIDIGFVEEKKFLIENEFRNIICVASFPFDGNFYNKKFSVLVKKRN